jgi:hypothetical protein
MRQFFQTIWWWFRVALLVTVGLYTLALIWNNLDAPPISVWYWFGREQEMSFIKLACVSFVLGGILFSTFFALSSAWVRYRRTHEHRRRRLIDAHRAELSRKAAMLRIKPAPVPTVRHPKPAPVAPATAPATVPAIVPVVAPVVSPVVAPVVSPTQESTAPEPIVVDIPPPPKPRTPFATEQIPVKVDDVIIVTPKRIDPDSPDLQDRPPAP